MKAVVLSAGFGKRLRPITDFYPKALVPVANRPLLDWALERAQRVANDVAVNVHAGRDAMIAHLRARRVHVSIEEPEALGTAGALGALKGWLGGEGCLVLNVDAFCPDPLDRLVAGWSGESVRLLVTYDHARPDFEDMWRFAGASLLPARWIEKLEARPAGLYEVCWRRELAEGSLELVPSTSIFIDCGAPGDLLAANLTASGGQSVIAADAVVEGSVHQSLVLPGGRVGPAEQLVRAIRLPSGETLLPFPSSLATHR
ncbi:MAG: NTP transferase domain-containing protein [Actinomycetota bacterium]|nr:NTP transferase domain-containing protein [Actinomycetota bacterium]